ncbi:MAG: NADP-specific glutamate dehydrogenase [Bacteroidetes bacterium]|jgi:glutamate dehydrogenase (NADP+)|nr:NADP-specific glutamate dehydrogenase [Bacteroidota bacterium]
MSIFIETLKEKNPNEPEFIQAVEEYYESVEPVIESTPKYQKFKILERMTEAERIITFSVPWIDDAGEIQINRGYRVQMNSALGPYKGGLRFHPSVNLSILKFLAFEQISKNALTSLPLGGGKGGSDFDPKGKSDHEVMRFCHAFMNELFRHIGDNTDIPAGDIGVGSREIGYLFGKYKRIKNQFTGVLTGKGINWGGSLIRPEATGYGLIYFAKYMLEHHGGDQLKNKVCLVSGAGNVAQYAIQKLINLGAKVISASDSTGFIVDEGGFTREKLDLLMDVKNVRREGLESYAAEIDSVHFQAHDYDPEASVWQTKADCAFPCATQNEIEGHDAQNLIENGVRLIAEGSNMSCTNEAIGILQDSDVLYAPGKATNAGGVAVSGLEMTQNSQRMAWSRAKVDKELKDIMKHIHDQCLSHAVSYNLKGNYVAGANIAAFLKVADAMIDQGVV